MHDDAESLYDKFQLVRVNVDRHCSLVVVAVVRRLGHCVEYPPQFVHVVRTAAQYKKVKVVNLYSTSS